MCSQARSVSSWVLGIRFFSPSILYINGLTFRMVGCCSGFVWILDADPESLFPSSFGGWWDVPELCPNGFNPEWVLTCHENSVDDIREVRHLRVKTIGICQWVKRMHVSPYRTLIDKYVRKKKTKWSSNHLPHSPCDVCRDIQHQYGPKW